MLRQHPHVFHAARTARCLAVHWQSLKQVRQCIFYICSLVTNNTSWLFQYCLLPDQSVQPLPKDNHILNFLDAESAVNDSDVAGEEKDEIMDHELALSDRRWGHLELII